jgi:hypothetical protein
MRNESLKVWLRRRACACAGLSLILATSVHAQLSAPIGTIYTQHGIYNWAGASNDPLFNIPGDGFMRSPGMGYPIVTGNTPISTFVQPVVAGAFFDWITLPNPLFPTFGGARTTMAAFSTGNAAGLVWANYLVGDRTPLIIQGGSYNISGGDLWGTVGPLGWRGRAGMVFPFQVVSRKGWGYAALGAAFELEIYDQFNQLQMMFDLGVTIATDGVGPLPDGLGRGTTITSSTVLRLQRSHSAACSIRLWFPEPCMGERLGRYSDAAIDLSPWLEMGHPRVG